MKIKIIKCSNSSWWYNNHIGLVVDVDDIDTDNFYELSTPRPRSITANASRLSVLRNDLIIVDRELKLKRILSI